MPLIARLPCILLSGIFWFILAGGTARHDAYTKIRYQLDDDSRLYLKGTSNVNTFICDCQDRFDTQVIETEHKAGITKYRYAELRMRTQTFNCHNRKIDSDMHKALKADRFPLIKVALLETRQPPHCLEGNCPDWFDVQAKVAITITDATRTETLPARARIIGPNRFQIRGNKMLAMTDFGIAPPQAMLGLIQVNNAIAIYFDLTIQVDDVNN